MGLARLWKRVCRGEVPDRDRKWFFRAFCAVGAAEFERKNYNRLSEYFPIERRLDGWVKPYDTVAILCALGSIGARPFIDARPQIFKFGEAKVASQLFLFDTAAIAVATQPVKDVMSQTLDSLVQVEELCAQLGLLRVRGSREGEAGGSLTPADVHLAFVRTVQMRSGRIGKRRKAVDGEDDAHGPASLDIAGVKISYGILSRQPVHMSLPPLFVCTANKAASGRWWPLQRSHQQDFQLSELISMPEMIGTLVRLAKALQRKANPAAPLAAHLGSLADRFEALLQGAVVPRLRLRTKAEDPFLHAIYTPYVRARLGRHTASLREVFNVYGSIGANRSSGRFDGVVAQTVIGMDDALLAMRNADLVGGEGRITHNEAVGLIAATRADLQPVVDVSFQLLLAFDDFCELMARFCYCDLRLQRGELGGPKASGVLGSEQQAVNALPREGPDDQAGEGHLAATRRFADVLNEWVATKLLARLLPTMREQLDNAAFQMMERMQERAARAEPLVAVITSSSVVHMPLVDIKPAVAAS
ncbi:hypothetical protein T492DRAFT_839397 [Pavlovales sp. CCMP2436]|nr:hypothetical protein T492DRAFT_839397 [Pavlovales sp. CCMP2436]